MDEQTPVLLPNGDIERYNAAADAMQMMTPQHMTGRFMNDYVATVYQARSTSTFTVSE